MGKSPNESHSLTTVEKKWKAWVYREGYCVGGVFGIVFGPSFAGFGMRFTIWNSGLAIACILFALISHIKANAMQTKMNQMRQQSIQYGG